MRQQLPRERMGLQPYFIPPSLFTSKEWFVAEDGKTRWFYHRDRKTFAKPPMTTALDPTIDEGLRPLVAAVRRLGIVTGPSCEGHIARNVPQGLAPEVMAHARKVRNSGLVVTNVETGEKHLWHDPTYRVDKNLMLDAQHNEQVYHLIGVLPLRGVPQALSRVEYAVSSTPGVWADTENGWYNVWVGTGTKAQQRATWYALARRVNSASV